MAPKTCDAIDAKRGLALLVACLAKTVAGSVSVFSIYANSLKETMNYTQTEVAIIASMHIVGSNLVIPAGILYDRFGPRVTTIVGFILSTIGYSLVYHAVLNPAYYSKRSELFAFYFFLSNHGVLYMYMASLVTSVKNFSPNNRAKVVALLDTMYGSGLMIFFSLYSEFFVNGHVKDPQNQNLSGFILLLLILTISAYVLCILFLRVYPRDPEVEELEMTESPAYTILEEAGSDTECEGSKELQRAPAQEHHVTDSTETLTQCEYIKFGLWRNFFCIKFQCLMWAFVLLASTTGMFMSNLTAITRSVHLTRYNWPLTTAISLSGIVMRFVLSPLSDYLYPTVPRAVFLIGGDALSVLSYFMLIFYMDEFSVLLTAGMMVGVSIAGSYTFGTTMLSEHFGTAHLGLNFGVFKLFDALSGFLMQTAFGSLYDAQIPEVNRTAGVKNCYGKHCAQGSMGLASIVTGVATLAALGFLIKQLMERRGCKCS